MLTLFEAISFWHWIILALLLLGGEALGAAGFMIGISLSALIVSALMAIGVIHDWQYQFLLFALFSVIASVVFWKFFRIRNETDAAGIINDRAAQLIGRKLKLQNKVENNLGRIQLGDTYWKVTADEDLEEGTQIEIYASEGMTLKIRKTA